MPNAQVKPPNQRRRARAPGIRIGEYPPGRFNAITDVSGVRVGHSTIIRGEGALRPGEGPVRTGVTAILPHQGNIFSDRAVASGFVLNGAGEVSGLMQVMEWGMLETPILITNTLAVGTVSDACVRWLVEHNPGIGDQHDVVIPVVGECDDSWLNDAAGRHVTPQHVSAAIDAAASGPVAEGNVGGGTGVITCDFKAGIGTSSRKLPQHEGGYTVGVLVSSNFGRMIDLRVDGVPVGEMIAPKYASYVKRGEPAGSIIVVVATNAPLLPHQVGKLCKRAALGAGRIGSYAHHGSGEFVIGFSNANSIPRVTRKMVYRMKVLLDRVIDPLYKATVEAAEEAILNSMCMAESMEGQSGHVAPALPLDEVAELVRRYRPRPASD